jgi:hypothetical protein
MSLISLDKDGEMFGEPELLLQPVTKPISQDQLNVELTGIYAGLVLVEAECIGVDFSPYCFLT